MYTPKHHTDHLMLALAIALAAAAVLAYEVGLVASGGLALLLAAHIYWLADRVPAGQWLIAPTEELTTTIGTCSAVAITILGVLALVWRI